MCGRFNISSTKETLSMLETIGTNGTPIFSSDIAPGARISIIHPSRKIEAATWWLFLDPVTLKPNYKYSSFNSRSDKLNQPRSIAYKPYRESRCIIPASAFVEGLGDKKTYHKVELVDQAIAFGGLFKEHINQNTGEIVFSASIITLPPVEEWLNIHPNSLPLILDYKDSAIIDKWLDPDFTDVDSFSSILSPEINHVQKITPIDRPSMWKPIGGSFLIS